MSRISMNIEVTAETADFLEEAAEKEGTTKEEILRRGLSVMKAYDEQRAQGNTHIGFTPDPDGLAMEMTGLFRKQPRKLAQGAR